MKIRSPLFAPDPPPGGGGGNPPPGGGNPPPPPGNNAPPPGGNNPPPPPGNNPPPGGGNPPPATPWYKDWIKEDGTINRDSYARMPEALKGLTESELKNPATIDLVMAKMQSLSALAGRKALAPLPPTASPEDRQAQDAILHAVNGAPEKPDYGFKRPDALPDGAWDDNYAKTIQGVLHKHHASPALAQELLAAQTAQVQANLTAQADYEKQFFKQQDDTFRTEIGKQGLDYDKTLSMITKAAGTFGMSADEPMLKNAGVRMMMLKVAQSIGEAKFIGGEGAAGGTKSDRATAEDIMHNKDNPEHKVYWAGVNGNPEHPKAGEVRQRVNQLLEAAVRAERAEAGRR